MPSLRKKPQKKVKKKSFFRQKVLAENPFFVYHSAMTKTLQIGSMVRIGHLFLIVEDIDGAFFFGSDDSGDCREYAVKDIDKVIE